MALVPSHGTGPIPCDAGGERGDPHTGGPDGISARGAPPAPPIDVRGQQDPAFLPAMMGMVIAMITLIISGNLNFLRWSRHDLPRPGNLRKEKTGFGK